MRDRPPPLSMEHSAAYTFLKTVLRSGLLESAELRAALNSMATENRGDADAVADHLVKMGRLSRFQARKLLQGTFRGLLLGPYQVLAPIGRGGMGTVYLARDSRTQTLMAIKILPPKKAREEERMLARFQREMEMCQRVAHPHLTRTYAVGVQDGVYYIAMEFIPGMSLYRLVSDQGPLAVPRAARLFAEVAVGLHSAHRQGLIHRDLKPSNIIVTPNDHAKVLDLGLALIQGEAPADRTVVGGQGYVVGTMDYLAPEQADDPTKVDARADVYSLGCTLYFALTGRPPFPGGITREKIARHRSDEPPPIIQLNPDVPPAFNVLVRKMMAKRPEQRFATAEELRQNLFTWADGEPVLPLDQEKDSNYRQAVIALETAEGPVDVSGDEIPDAMPSRQWPAHSARNRVRSPVEPSPEAMRQVYWVTGVLAALMVATVMLLVLGAVWLLS